jgi:hypothetical protein
MPAARLPVVKPPTMPPWLPRPQEPLKGLPPLQQLPWHPYQWLLEGVEPPRVPLVTLGPQAQEGRLWPEAKEASGNLPCLLPHPWLAALVSRHHSWPLVELVVVGAEPPWVILGPEA